MCYNKTEYRFQGLYAELCEVWVEVTRSSEQGSSMDIGDLYTYKEGVEGEL